MLCYLEGLTHQEAAVRLACPMGTLHSRLVRGRNQLRRRLIRRGMAPAAGPLGVLLADESARTAVPAPITDSTIRSAKLISAGQKMTTNVVSATVAALIHRGQKAMFLHKLKMVGRAMFVGGVIVAGTAVWAQQGSRVPPRSTNGSQNSRLGVEAQSTSVTPPIDKNRQARLLLEEVAKVYKTLPGYSMKGELQNEYQIYQAGFGRQQTTVRSLTPIELAYSKHDNFLVSLGANRLIADGKTLTTVVPPQFMQSPAPAHISVAPILEFPLGFVFSNVGLTDPVTILLNLFQFEPAQSVEFIVKITAGTPILEPDVKVNQRNIKSIFIPGAVRTILVKGQKRFADIRILVDPISKMIERIEVDHSQSSNVLLPVLNTKGVPVDERITPKIASNPDEPKEKQTRNVDSWRNLGKITLVVNSCEVNAPAGDTFLFRPEQDLIKVESFSQSAE